MTPAQASSLARQIGSATRKPKYGNRVTVVDGVRFDSTKEARRWGELQLLQRAGEISDLRRQVSYPLSVNGRLIGHIIPDFVYRRAGAEVCEDVKSSATITQLFKWKAKHLLHEHGIKVEVRL